MNPRYFVPIAKAAFPKTTSGKIQRTQLKTGLAAGDFNEILNTIAAREASAARVAPRTELESWLAEIWEQALDVRQIGIHDDFLDRGGDSLKAMQIWGRLRDAFPVELPLGRILLECSTIAKLAEVIEETLIEKLQGLSEREAESLLQNDADVGAEARSISNGDEQQARGTLKCPNERISYYSAPNSRRPSRRCSIAGFAPEPRVLGQGTI